MKKEEQFLDGIPIRSKKKKYQLAIFKQTRLIITIIASALGLYFGFLQISGIEVDALKNDQFADTLMKIALLVYYLAWVNGMLMDLKDEEAIFILPPNKGKYTSTAWGVIIALTVVFFSLCLFKSKSFFVLILDVFMVVNFFSWKFLIKFISDSVNENKEFYNSENKNFKNIYLWLLVDEYLKGAWQKWRFIVGIFMLVGLNVLVFTDLSLIISSDLKFKSAELVKAVGFILFIAVWEGWVWYMRLKRRISIDLIDTLEEDYYLTIRRQNQ